MRTLIYIQPRVFGFSSRENIPNMEAVNCEEIMKQLSLASLRSKQTSPCEE